MLVSEQAPQQTFRLAKMNNLMGRDDSADILVNDQRISRKHCLLEVWEQHVKVKDLDSSNGTYVNGILVRDGFLNIGDQLSLGGYKLILHKEQKKAPDMATN
jgi:pSer/pThr/pTyr-binding forkhead associated (FHA) protein